MVSLAEQYQPGDWVIYKKSKYSAHPGPRAQNVAPAQRGEKYAYTVAKFWVVGDVLDDGRLLLLTRRGKEHVMDCNDPALHLAKWWERLLYRNRFAAVQESTSEATD